MKTLKEIVLEAEKKNKVVIMTIHGPMSVDIDKFISQPAEGLLYDLNRDRITCLTWLDDPKAGKYWVNNHATMFVVTKLKKYYDFYDSVACLIAEGSEFMDKSELYDAIKREHGKVNKEPLMDILSIIKLKNPEDITPRELDTFRLVIEEAEKHLNKLQDIHRSLTGRNYIPPIR